MFQDVSVRFLEGHISYILSVRFVLVKSMLASITKQPQKYIVSQIWLKLISCSHKIQNRAS